MSEQEVREAVIALIRSTALAAHYEVCANPLAHINPKPGSACAWFKSMGGDQARKRREDPEVFTQKLASRLAALVCVRLPEGQRTLVAIKDEIGVPT